MKRILVTGGAGFVGSSLCLLFKRDNPDAEVIAFDNLRRRGSELALPRLRQAGVQFVHGDIRMLDDLKEVAPVDLMIECSAEPSVHAGYDGRSSYVVQTNLAGTVNCLEYARATGADMLFLSTSRVYPIERLRGLPLVQDGQRFSLGGASGAGWSAAGIATDFPLTGTRSLYGATKLASELMIAEYAAMYKLRTVINRCGILAGPWQMGKVDQGVMVLWAARHLYGGRLSYTGYEGLGLQVRDVLHIADLYDLLVAQYADIDRHKGSTYNVGGGPEFSVSIAELTEKCRRFAGKTIAIGSDKVTRDADIPWYVTDIAEVTAATGWAPRRSVDVVLEDIFQWLHGAREQLEPLLNG